MSEIIAVALYICILLGIGIASYHRNFTSSEFILGGRKMNFWVTALAAHASDMSSWIFMAYPAVIFAQGLSNFWAAIGLTLFMYLNWQFVAKKVRIETAKYECMTYSSFFEARFADTTGWIRVLTAVMLFIFYVIYISAGMTGMGIVINSLFGLDYWLGVTLGVLVVIPYLFIGGYVTLAWTDLFQGIFLLIVIVLVPSIVLPMVGGMDGIEASAKLQGISLNLLPEGGIWSALAIMVSWGLGYFGQPHIVTKFMGISDPNEIHKSKYIGMSWQIIALCYATLIGLVAIPFFQNGISDPQLIFIRMTESIFPPFLAAFVLCAILGATITNTDSQILVLVSSLTEDFYKRVFRKSAGSRELLWVSRLSIFLVAIIAYFIALRGSDTIYELVSYAWFGLGSSFGPLLLFSLFSKKTTKQGAWAGILVGGAVAALWPLSKSALPTLVPGFGLSSIAIYLTSKLTFNTREPFHEA
ncbi:MAG: sodium/proline symporter [Simkaniaceae bacterium]|nr:sodium/proline symporter [Simkaniaceae bacterium]